MPLATDRMTASHGTWSARSRATARMAAVGTASTTNSEAAATSARSVLTSISTGSITPGR